jgi:hypothetical protein
MERLTEKQIDGTYYIYGNNMIREVSCCDENNKNWFSLYEGNAIDKLGRYEDLEEQGRLIKLPLKVGDVVYYEHPYVAILTGIKPYKITNIMINQNKKGEWTRKYRAMLLIDGKTVDRQINFAFNDIGKTVFLTKEEDEKALAEMGE